MLRHKDVSSSPESCRHLDAVQVTFYSTQSVGTPPAPTGSPPSPAMQLLDPDEAAQTLATQAATNNTALFVTSPELVSSERS